MRIVSVGDIAERIDYGVTASAMVDPVGPKMLRITDIQDGAVNWSSVPHCSRTTAGVETRQLAAGDIVFARTGTVGKSFLIRERPEGAVFASYLIRLRLWHEVADSRYVSHFFRSPGYWQQIASASDGGVQKGVNATKLRNLLVPLPPIGDQRRIADVLDAADALRAKRRLVIAKLDTLMQAIFIDMFGNLTSSTFESVAFGSLLQKPLRNGISPSKSGTVVGTVLTLSAVTGSAFEHTAKKESTFTRAHPPEKTVSVEDFLICRGNGNLSLMGRGKYPNRSMPDVAFPDTMIAARCDPGMVSRGYVARVWNDRVVRGQLESLARTTNGTHKINQSMIESIEFPMPPIRLQRKFDRAKQAASAHRVRLECAAERLESLFASLQQRAFRGDL